MERRTKIIIATAAVATSFAVGRFTTPEHVRVETKTVEKIVKVKDTDTVTKKKKRTEIVVNPDGTKKIIVVEDTDKEKKESEKTDTDKKTDSKTDKTKGSTSLTTLGIVGGYSSKGPVVGISCYRPVLGPIGIGIIVTTPTDNVDPTIAAEIGLSF